MYWQNRFNRENPDADLEEKIKEIRQHHKDFGYRRIWGKLRVDGIMVNRKKIQHIVQKLGLQVKSFTHKSRKYNSYKGTIGRIATTLGARYLDEKVFPYSFREYLGACGVELEDGWMYGKQKNIVQQKFADYFKWGGFPELLLFRNKRHWLNNLYEKIILGDVIQRNKVKNEHALRLAVKRLAENVKQPTAYNRLANMVKSTGVSTNTASIIEYIRYVKEACLMFTLDNYASKFVEKETAKKHYFTDNGLLSIFLTDADTSLLENLCAIHLCKQYNKDDDSPRLFYYNRNIEVDFYIPDESLAIQAAYSIQDDDTRTREVNALVALNKIEPLKKACIITYDEEDTLEVNGLKIDIVPIWKWLLK